MRSFVTQNKGRALWAALAVVAWCVAAEIGTWQWSAASAIFLVVSLIGPSIGLVRGTLVGILVVIAVPAILAVGFLGLWVLFYAISPDAS